MHPAGLTQHVCPMAQAAPPLQEQALPAPQASPGAHSVNGPPAGPHRQVSFAVQVPVPPARHSEFVEQAQNFCVALPPSHSKSAAGFPCELQELPHPPQLSSPFKLVFAAFCSQPLSIAGAAGVVQLANPRSHVESQSPLVQLFDATPVPEHARPQAPQWLTLEEVLTSHPVAAIPSQSLNPALHARPHVLFTQAPTALGAFWQTVPHIPQFAGSFVVGVSQPFAFIPSQLPKPALHPPSAQTPMLQEAPAFANEQPMLHIPQCDRLVCVLASQPLAGLLSQFAKGAVQLATWHEPAMQAPVPLAGLHA